MNTLWKPTAPKSDNVILIYENTIYKGKVAREALATLTAENPKEEILKNLYSVPFSYIKSVVNQEGMNHIKIYYGHDSEEELNVYDETLKNEIFNGLKEALDGFGYRTELPGVIKYTKAQLFAILIATVIFIWAMSYAIELAKGTQYELTGGRPGIDGVVFAIANVGIPKLIIGYLLVLGIALLALFRRLNSRTNMQILER